MTIEAGTVVTLKSGGEPMTVVAVDGDNAECVWCGEEGDLFRETIPTLALLIALPANDEDDEEEDDEDAESEDEAAEATDGETEADEDAADTRKKAKRSAA